MKQRMKAPPAAGPFGRGAHGGFDDGLEDLPAHDFAHAQQGRLERCHIEVLHELIEESGVAGWDEICQAFACLNSSRFATLCSNYPAKLSFRECP